MEGIQDRSARRVRGTAAGTLRNEQHILQQLKPKICKARLRAFSGTLAAMLRLLYVRLKGGYVNKCGLNLGCSNCVISVMCSMAAQEKKLEAQNSGGIEAKPDSQQPQPAICAFAGENKCGYFRFNGKCMGEDCSLHPSRKQQAVR